MLTSREASKCLANILLLESKTRQIFVDLGYPAKAAQRLKVRPSVDACVISIVT